MFNKKLAFKIFGVIFGLIFLSSSVTQIVGLFDLAPSKKAEKLLVKAREAFEKKDEQKALQYLRTAKELTPRDANLYLFAGNILRLGKNLKQAKEEYQKALELDPQNGVVHEMLGVIYGQENKPQMAEVEFKTSLKYLPQNPSALNNLGILYMQQKRWKEAEQSFFNAVMVNRDYPDVQRNLGILYQSQGQKEKSIPHFERYLKLVPNDPESAMIRAYIEK